MISQFIVLVLLWPLYPSYVDLHAFISVTGCSLHGMPSQITLEAIPVDVLCEIWEVLDNVEHLTCERVSDPHKVCRNCVVCDSWMFMWMLWGTVHYLVVTFECCYCLHNYTSETLATFKCYVSHVLSLPWCLYFLYTSKQVSLYVLFVTHGCYIGCSTYIIPWWIHFCLIIT